MKRRYLIIAGLIILISFSLTLSSTAELDKTRKMKAEAEYYFEKGSYYKAIDIWAEVLKMDSCDKEALEGLQKAQELLKKSRTEKEKAERERLVELIQEGKNYYRDKEYQKALSCWGEALSLDPVNKEVLDLIEEGRIKAQYQISILDKLDKEKRLKTPYVKDLDTIANKMVNLLEKTDGKIRIEKKKEGKIREGVIGEEKGKEGLGKEGLELARAEEAREAERKKLEEEMRIEKEKEGKIRIEREKARLVEEAKEKARLAEEEREKTRLAEEARSQSGTPSLRVSPPKVAGRSNLTEIASSPLAEFTLSEVEGLGAPRNDGKEAAPPRNDKLIIGIMVLLGIAFLMGVGITAKSNLKSHQAKAPPKKMKKEGDFEPRDLKKFLKDKGEEKDKDLWRG